MNTNLSNTPLTDTNGNTKAIGDDATENTITPGKAIAIVSGLSVFGIVVALILVEIGFRIFATQGAPKAPWSDRPHAYFSHQGAQSFSDAPYNPVKPPGTIRIAAIGDSFTFAPFMQFDDSYPKRLERELNLNSTQPRVEVINYGVPAYSTSHEVPVVKRAVHEGADLLLMQITLNDPEIKPYTPQELSRDKNKFGDLELTNPIFNYWSSLAFVLKRIHNEETRSNYKKKFFRLFERADTWGNFESSWRKVAQSGKESGVPVVAVIFPLFGYPVDDKYPFWPIHQKIDALLTTLNVPHLDVTEIYRDIPLARLQVIPGVDFHPNEIAHRMAAEAMLPWLKGLGSLPDTIFPKCESAERIGIKVPECR